MKPIRIPRFRGVDTSITVEEACNRLVAWLIENDAQAMKIAADERLIVVAMGNAAPVLRQVYDAAEPHIAFAGEKQVGITVRVLRDDEPTLT
jgi:hypothetical protein